MTGHTRSAAPETAAQPRVGLPSRLLLASLIVTVLLVVGTWSAAVALGPWGMREFVSGMVGIAATAFMAACGIFVMKPWKQRAIADWMTMWLAGTVFRLLGTPILVYLLYSAASSSLGSKPLAISVAFTYLATLFVEAAILARHMKSLL